MALYLKVMEFDRLNKMAEGCGVVLELTTLSAGGCAWTPLYEVKRSGEVVFKANDAWQVERFLIALDFLQEITQSCAAIN